MYLTYSQYLALGGEAEQLAFERAEARVEARMDALTHGRLKALTQKPEAVRLAALEATELLLRYQQEDEEGRPTSISNDGMSVSLSRSTARERDAALNTVIADYLWGLRAEDGRTPLLYAGALRGVCP